MEDRGVGDTSDNSSSVCKYSIRSDESRDSNGSSQFGMYLPDTDLRRSNSDLCLLDTDSEDLSENDACDTSEDVDDDSKYEINSSIVSDKTQESSILITEDTPEIVDIVDETLEENNNDPNNNMDSIETNVRTNEEAILLRFDSTTNRAGRREAPPLVTIDDRGESPKPGCSKDSMPVSTTFSMPYDPSNNDTIHEKVRHVLCLVSKISHNSIFDALSENYDAPVTELKLWDLIPVMDRLIYLEIVSSSRNKRSCEPSEPFVDNNAMQTQQMTTTTNNSGKRGSADDICTIKSKKSSSDPDLSILAPAASPPSIPKVSSTTEISDLSRKPNVHRGAIPKVRDAQSNQRSNAISSKVKVPHSVDSLTAHLNSFKTLTSPTVVKAPFLKYPLKRSFTSKSNSAELQKLKTALAVSRSLSKPITPKQAMQLIPPIQPMHPMHPIPSVPPIQPMHLIHRMGPIHPIPSVPPIQPMHPMHLIHRMDPKHPRPSVPPMHPITTNQQSQKIKEMQKQTEPPAKQQNTERTICMEIYYKLRVIFPNVDPDYLKKLCPPEWGPGNRDDQLAPIVEHLLESADTLPRVPINESNDHVEPDTSYNSVDDIYENLLGIFPDADPHYLRDFAVTNIGKADVLKNFVESKLERRDYPTREQYMARLKITEQQRQYTTGFDVKQFLSIIPDPAEQFMDPKRKCIHRTVAFEFLKSYFNRNRVSTISKMYLQCNHNLSLTAECLEDLGPDIKTKRGGYEMPTEDILLLQEIAFIKHKTEINEYIANLKRSEDEEFRLLKRTNQLLECQCCYDNECLPSKCSTCDTGHIFCNKCIVTGTNAKMSEDETRIKCFINCGSEFSLSVLQRVLVPTTFSILLKKRQAAEVIEAGLEGLVSCPFCHFASIPPEGDKLFKCLNPECTKESCRLCKELSHVPLKCDEVLKADKARHYVEEKMTEALARKCYKCQRTFFKEEGCNKITCPCGAKMCYLCDEPIKDYLHFRGQGSDNSNLCPLYSDTIRLDAVAVRKVAERAQLEVSKRNPNVKIDTTYLLPDIPRPSEGPHNNILNADELPRRAQRFLELPPP